MSFKNKVVMVTGSGSGIGRATAIRLAKLEAILVLIDKNEAKLKNIEEECKKYSKNSKEPLVIMADVTEEATAKVIIDATVEKFNKIDVLINNAGAAFRGNFASSDAIEIYDKTEKLVLRHVIRLTHTALPYLEKTKGAIVMVSSINAIQAVPTSWAYCVAKAGLDHFTRCLAVELAPKGIRVNSVNPGPVKTDIYKNLGYDDEKIAMAYEVIKEKTLLQRVSEPDEIADMIEFLASDRARGVTGSHFVCDNGMLFSAYRGENVPKSI